VELLYRLTVQETLYLSSLSNNLALQLALALHFCRKGADANFRASNDIICFFIEKADVHICKYPVDMLVIVSDILININN